VSSERVLRPTLRHRLAYAGIRLGAFALACADIRGAARLASAAARLVGLVDRRHRSIAEDNIRRAYGDRVPGGDARRLALRVYERLGVTAAEFVHGARRQQGKGAWERSLRVEGAEALRKACGGRPVVFVSAHFGSWEQGLAAATAAGFPARGIGRPLANPLLWRWIQSVRRGSGTVAFEKYGALRALLRLGRDGWSVAILVDQNAGRRGILVPFFGRPCATIPTPVVLARRLGVPLCVATLHRRSPGFHRLVLGPAVIVGERTDAEVMTEVNRVLEERIRTRPEDWLWLHRRWRIKDDWGLGPASPTEGAATAPGAARTGGAA
jgi:KDO2-lipid IV(A) lauroyltransferase